MPLDAKSQLALPDPPGIIKADLVVVPAGMVVLNKRATQAQGANVADPHAIIAGSATNHGHVRRQRIGEPRLRWLHLYWLHAFTDAPGGLTAATGPTVQVLGRLPEPGAGEMDWPHTDVAGVPDLSAAGGGLGYWAELGCAPEQSASPVYAPAANPLNAGIVAAMTAKWVSGGWTFFLTPLNANRPFDLRGSTEILVPVTGAASLTYGSQGESFADVSMVLGHLC